MKLERTDDGARTVLRIKGELDSITAPEVRATFDEVVESETKQVELDLSALRVIDSSGVGAIVSLFKRMRAYGGKLEVSGVSGQPLSIFKVLNLIKVLGIQ
jgi:anti-sigma B factor antagonist